MINQLTSLQNAQSSGLISNELFGYLDKLFSSLHQSKYDYSLLVDLLLVNSMRVIKDIKDFMMIFHIL